MLQLEKFLDPADILRLIEEKFGTGIWRCDAAGRMQWSRGFYGLLGLDSHMVEPSFVEIQRRIHPEDRRATRDPLELVLDRSLLGGEFRIIRPNGALRWIRVQSEVMLDSDGEPECVLGVAIDITEQRRSMRPLKIDAARYAALTEVESGLMWIGNPDGRITALPNAEENPEAQRFLGKGWLDLLHQDDREVALKCWAVAVETGRLYCVEYRLRQPDGSYRWYRCKAVPVTNPDGGTRDWMGIFTDVHHERLFSQLGAISRLTGAQLRGARGMLNWSVKQLAARIGMSSAVVRRFEEQNGDLRLPEDTMLRLRDTLSAAGIEFIFPAAGKPGVRPK